MSRRLTAPADPERSPYTGYTRVHWLDLAERLLAGVLPYLDAKTGLPNLRGVPGDRGHLSAYGGHPTVAKWQAMERIMMLAVYYSAAAGRDRVPGWNGSVSEVFRTGIRRMTNPSDPLFCPRLDPSVYLGSETALAALLSPVFFWDPFTTVERARILDFVGELARQKAYDNNHHLFHLVPVPLLERHGRATYRDKLTPLLDRMLEWHRGDGWFIDGSNRGFDHYNFWGFHLYLNVLSHLDPTWNEQFGDRFRDLTRRFLRTTPYFFGRDGGPIPWGRSLAYRFADLSAIGWAQINGANPLPPGQARRIASGCLKYFWDRGAQHESGLLELGYHSANAVAAENYLTDGTGYFAVQGFACLLIPEADPFWTAEEQPMPADGKGGRLVLPGAEMVVRVSPHDGEARMFPVGQPFGHDGKWQRGAKYAQHAYSSAFGWCALGEGSEELGAGRTGWSHDGKAWSYRSHPVARKISTDHVASVCLLSGKPSAPSASTDAVTSSPELHTHTLISDRGEVHVFWHTSASPLWLYLGGYGINAPGPHELSEEIDHDSVRVAGRERWSMMHQAAGPKGRFAVRVLAPRPGWLHSHLFGGIGAFPEWRSAAPVAARQAVVILVHAAAGQTPYEPLLRVERDGADLRVAFDRRDYRLPLSSK